MVTFHLWTGVAAMLALFTVIYYALQPLDEAFGDYYVP